MPMQVRPRPATKADDDALWAMLCPVFRAGDTYAIDPQIDRASALRYWSGDEREVWVFEGAEGIAGSYYLKANAGGGGAHVCNAGFVTAAASQGKGVARAMLAHALERARSWGFAAMQFNFVVATNARAVDLWKRAGFDVVGTLPGAFRHPRRGAVDAYVMYRRL